MTAFRRFVPHNSIICACVLLIQLDAYKIILYTTVVDVERREEGILVIRERKKEDKEMKGQGEGER